MAQKKERLSTLFSGGIAVSQNYFRKQFFFFSQKLLSEWAGAADAYWLHCESLKCLGFVERAT